MPSPQLVASRTTSSATEFAFQVPDVEILQGDVLLLIATSSVNFFNNDWGEEGTKGWDRHLLRNQASHATVLASKVANGDERDQAYSNTGDAGAVVSEVIVVRGVDLNRDLSRLMAESGLGAVDPPGFTAPVADSLWVAFAGLDDSDGVTGGDPAYTALGSVSATAACCQVSAYLVASSATQDPLPWTNTGNEEWAAGTVALPPLAQPSWPSIVRHDETNGFNVADRSITVPDGTNRVLLVATNGPVTSVTFDPSGLNLPMSLVTDGTTQAFANHASDGAKVRVWSIDPADIPAAGSYICRVDVGGDDWNLSSVVINNAEQALQVAHVATSIVSGDTVTSVVPSSGGLVVYFASRLFAGGVSGETDPWTTYTSDGIRMRQFGTVYAVEAGGGGVGYGTVFARGYASGGNIDGVIASGSSQGVVAVTIGYVPVGDNAPWWGTEF